MHLVWRDMLIEYTIHTTTSPACLASVSEQITEHTE